MQIKVQIFASEDSDFLTLQHETRRLRVERISARRQPNLITPLFIGGCLDGGEGRRHRLELYRSASDGLLLRIKHLARNPRLR